MYSPVRRTLSPDFSSTSCCREQNVKKCIVRCSFVERRIVATSSQSSWRAEWQVVICVVHRRKLAPSGPTALCPTVLDFRQVRQAVDTLLKTSSRRRRSLHHRPRGRARRPLSLCLLLPLAQPSTATAHLLHFLV